MRPVRAAAVSLKSRRTQTQRLVRCSGSSWGAGKGKAKAAGPAGNPGKAPRSPPDAGGPGPALRSRAWRAAAMAIAHLATEYVFSDFLLKEPSEPKFKGLRLELAVDKMVTCIAVGLPLLLISLAFAQEISIGKAGGAGRPEPALSAVPGSDENRFLPCAPGSAHCRDGHELWEGR